MNCCLRLSLVLWALVSINLAPASADPRPWLAMESAPGLFIKLPAKKFQNKQVACYRRNSGKFTAGFITKVSRQKRWNNLKVWQKSQMAVNPASASQHKKIVNQLQRACQSALKYCKPNTGNLTITVSENSPLQFQVPGTDSCNLPLTYVEHSSAEHGVVEANGLNLTYRPDPHSLLNDQFSFRVSNGHKVSNLGNVTVVLEKLRTEFAGQADSLLPYRLNLTQNEVDSLVKRIGFGDPSLRNYRRLDQLVDRLLDDTETPEASADFSSINQARLNTMLDPDPDQRNPRWFYNGVVNATNAYLRHGRPFRTWMSFMFWGNHFANNLSPWSNSDIHQVMIQHIDRLRNNALGNFSSLITDLFDDYPFHHYLDHQTNSVSNPNQNFPREFLELMTAGIKDPITGEANFTQADVESATRFLSGWRLNTAAYGYRSAAGVLHAPSWVRATDNDHTFNTCADCDCGTRATNKISVTWEGHVGAAIGYRVYRSPAFSGSQPYVDVLGGPTHFFDAPGCISNGASPGVVYQYWVKTLGANSTSSADSPIDRGYYLTSPSSIPAPSNLSASLGTYTDRVIFTWTRPAGVNWVQVYRKTSDGGRTETPISGLLPIGVDTFEDRDIHPGLAYNYYVRSVSSNGLMSDRVRYDTNGADNGEIAWGYASNSTPLVNGVKLLTASTGSNTLAVNLSWDSVPNAAGYRLFRAPYYSRFFQRLLPDVPGSLTSFADLSARPGVPYHYVVAPIDAHGAVGPTSTTIRFDPTHWNTSANNLEPRTFLEWLPDDHPNAGGKIGTANNGRSDGKVYSTFGQGFPNPSPNSPPVGNFVEHVLLNWPATSRNIAAKLFAPLANRNLSESVVSELASDLLSNDYNLKPVLRKILSSSAAFSPEANGTCVANPSEVVFSALRMANLPVTKTNTRSAIALTLASTGHDVTAPPSVFGYNDCGLVRGGIVYDGSDWTLSAQTYLGLGNGLSSILFMINAGSGYEGENRSLIEHFSPTHITTPDALVDHVAGIFDVPLSAQQKQILVDYLNTNDQGQINSGSAWRRTHLDRLSFLIRIIVMSVDFLKK